MSETKIGSATQIVIILWALISLASINDLQLLAEVTMLAMLVVTTLRVLPE